MTNVDDMIAYFTEVIGAPLADETVEALHKLNETQRQMFVDYIKFLSGDGMVDTDLFPCIVSFEEPV